MLSMLCMLCMLCTLGACATRVVSVYYECMYARNVRMYVYLCMNAMYVCYVCNVCFVFMCVCTYVMYACKCM